MLQAPAPEMRSSSRADGGGSRGIGGNRKGLAGAPSGIDESHLLPSMRPFTPPDLSSIPHMDEATEQPLGERGGPTSSSRSNEQTDGSGLYIVGSPIDLGTIDNVDSINLRLGSVRLSSTPQHIELQETASGDRSPTIRFSSEYFILFFS